jgi:hypothetical protein|nr:MAG: hypothetical protein DIU52_10995 [bacterium]
MMRRVKATKAMTILAAALFVAACGDAPTTDRRGYTKAPLEDPGLRIKSEPTTPMAEYAKPQLPEVVDIPPPDTSGAGASGS